MAKRGFTSAQMRRLKNFQALRVERAQHKKNLDDVDTSNLGSEQHGLLITHYSVAVIVQSDDGRFFTCSLRQNLSALVPGDHVVWQAIDENTGVVVACQPRRSVILRQLASGTKPIVANVDLMVIVVALAPAPQATTIDRYLILAQMMKLNTLIVINKIDISSTQEHEELLQQARVYETLGYRVIRVSTTRGDGIDELRHALKDLSSIVVGQSGVGKSSLLNALVPHAAAQTNTLSQRDKFGRQTTSASKLYALPHGGNLIDSPGIHQFSLHHFSKEQILSGYKEFSPYLGTCQFRNCLHANEPNCALKKAVQEQSIAAFRLQNYHQILLDHEE